LDVTRDTQ